MDIHCPLRSVDEIEPLVAAGARRFYAGVDSAVLVGARAVDAPIVNCRPWPGFNFTDEAGVRAACALVRRLDGELHLAFNWFDYRPWEIDAILEFLHRNRGLDGVVVADLTLVDRIHRELPELRIVLSTVANAQNGRAVDFFRARGVRQVVLPRHLTIDEIGRIVAAHPGVAFEAFIKNQDCHFSQGLCSYTHDVIDPALTYSCGAVRQYFPSRALSADESRSLQTLSVVVMNSCGVCSIADLHRVGVTGVKLVGREMPLDRKLRDVRFLRGAIDALERDAGAYGEQVRRLHGQVYGVECGRDCMY